jgi:hypothetical protein
MSYEVVSSRAARFVKAGDSDVTEDAVGITSVYPAVMYSLSDPFKTVMSGS